MGFNKDAALKSVGVESKGWDRTKAESFVTQPKQVLPAPVVSPVVEQAVEQTYPVARPEPQEPKSFFHKAMDVTSSALFKTVSRTTGGIAVQAGKTLGQAGEIGGAVGLGVYNRVGKLVSFANKDVGEKISTLGDSLYEKMVETRKQLDQSGMKTSRFLNEGAQEITDVINPEDKAYRQKNAGKNDFKISDLTDPEFLTYDLYKGLIENAGPMALAIYSGSKAQTATKAMSRVAQWIGSATAGTGVSLSINAAIEADSTYENAINQGRSEDQAFTEANRTFSRNLTGNLGFEGMQMLALFAPTAKFTSPFLGRLFKVAKLSIQGPLEAAQERGEDAIQEMATQESFDMQKFVAKLTDPTISKTDVVSAMLGIGMAGGGNIFIKEPTILKEVERQTREVLIQLGIKNPPKGEYAVNMLEREMKKNPDGVKEAFHVVQQRDISDIEETKQAKIEETTRIQISENKEEIEKTGMGESIRNAIETNGWMETQQQLMAQYGIPDAQAIHIMQIATAPTIPTEEEAAQQAQQTYDEMQGEQKLASESTEEIVPKVNALIEKVSEYSGDIKDLEDELQQLQKMRQELEKRTEPEAQVAKEAILLLPAPKEMKLLPAPKDIESGDTVKIKTNITGVERNAEVVEVREDSVVAIVKGDAHFPETPMVFPVEHFTAKPHVPKVTDLTYAEWKKREAEKRARHAKEQAEKVPGLREKAKKAEKTPAISAVFTKEADKIEGKKPQVSPKRAEADGVEGEAKTNTTLKPNFDLADNKITFSKKGWKVNEVSETSNGVKTILREAKDVMSVEQLPSKLRKRYEDALENKEQAKGTGAENAKKASEILQGVFNDIADHLGLRKSTIIVDKETKSTKKEAKKAEKTPAISAVFTKEADKIEGKKIEKKPKETSSTTKEERTDAAVKAEAWRRGDKYSVVYEFKGTTVQKRGFKTEEEANEWIDNNATRSERNQKIHEMVSKEREAPQKPEVKIEKEKPAPLSRMSKEEEDHLFAKKPQVSPKRAEAEKKHAEAMAKTEGTAEDKAKTEAFPVGVGFGTAKQQQRGAENIDRTIKNATKEVEARKKLEDIKNAEKAYAKMIEQYAEALEAQRTGKTKNGTEITKEMAKELKAIIRRLEVKMGRWERMYKFTRPSFEVSFSREQEDDTNKGIFTVYRGTKDGGELKESMDTDYGPGYYFADKKSTAEGYGANVVAYTVKLDNPLMVKNRYEMNTVFDEYIAKINSGEIRDYGNIQEYLKAQGYDGIKVEDGGLAGQEGVGGFTVAFDKEQVTVTKEKQAEDGVLSLLKSHETTVENLRTGKITPKELQDAFGNMVARESDIMEWLNKMTIAELRKKFGGYPRRDDTKKDVVKSSYRNLLELYAPSDSITYHAFSESYSEAVARYVNSATEETIAEYAKRVAERRAEREAWMKDKIQAIKDPQTLDQFRTFIEANGADKMTDEQRIRYDNLVAEKIKADTEKKIQQKALVKGVDAGVGFEIHQTKHTKTGADLYVVTMGARVEKDVYSQLNATAKKLGGYYSSFRGAGAIPGFQFKTPEDAQSFMKAGQGETVDTTEKITDKKEAQKSKTTNKLALLAEQLEERATEKLNQDRKTNTAKRAREASYAEESARADIQMAQTMKNLAGAIASGRAKFLDGITAKAHIEEMESALRQAKWKQENLVESQYRLDHKDDKGLLYDPYEGNQKNFGTATLSFSAQQEIRKLKEEIQNGPVTDQTISALDDIFPTFIGGNLVTDILEPASKKKGYKLLANRYMKIIPKGDKRWTPTSFQQVNDLADMMKQVDATGMYAYPIERTQRLQRMGVTSTPQFRAMLREYVTFRGDAVEADKATELERALVGSKVGFDFFPTPRTVADQMVQEAGITAGMKVLEPSAGNGNIAEAIRDAGSTPEVIELSSQLREILEAKGFTVVGQDFLEHTEGGYDAIIQNPPFSNNADIAHVKHAYDLLAPGGKLVSIVGEGAFFRSGKTETEFRDWLDAHEATVEQLPAGTFEDKTLMATTGANGRMVIIEKPKVDFMVRDSLGRFATEDMDTLNGESFFIETSNLNLAKDEEFQDAMGDVLEGQVSKTPLPVLVLKESDGKYSILDGRHRVAQAMKDGATEILVTENKKLYDTVAKSIPEFSSQDFEDRLEERLAGPLVDENESRRVLAEFTSRLGYDIPVQFFDKILTGEKVPALFSMGEKELRAWGVTYKGVFGFEKLIPAHTIPHEIIHFTINNLDQMADDFGITRMELLTAANDGKMPLSAKEEAEIGERIARRFERVWKQSEQGKAHTEKGIVGQFFDKLVDFIKRILQIKPSDIEILRNFYDKVLYMRRTGATVRGAHANLERFEVEPGVVNFKEGTFLDKKIVRPSDNYVVQGTGKIGDLRKEARETLQTYIDVVKEGVKDGDIYKKYDVSDVVITDVEIFGSRASGTAEESSDLDVLVSYTGKIDRYKMQDIMRNWNYESEGEIHGLGEATVGNKYTDFTFIKGSLDSYLAKSETVYGPEFLKKDEITMDMFDAMSEEEQREVIAMEAAEDIRGYGTLSPIEELAESLLNGSQKVSIRTDIKNDIRETLGKSLYMRMFRKDAVESWDELVDDLRRATGDASYTGNDLVSVVIARDKARKLAAQEHAVARRQARLERAEQVKEAKTEADKIKLIRDIEKDITRKLLAKKYTIKQYVAAIERSRKEGFKKGVRTQGDRAKRVNAIAEIHGLTDAQVRRVLHGRDFRIMTDSAFEDFIVELEQMKEIILEHSEAMIQLQGVIHEKGLVHVENLQAALDMPRQYSEMTTKQLRELEAILSKYEVGDVFLGIRTLETIDRTDLAGIRTYREAKMRLAKETGVPFSELEKIKVGELDRFRWDAILREQNVFYRMLVDTLNHAFLKGDSRTITIEKQINALIKAARKSRMQRMTLGEKIRATFITTDNFIFDWLEGDEMKKEELAKEMTREEMAAALFVQEYFVSARDYLVAQEMMKKYREDYITHIRRGFLEAWRESGLKVAVEEVMKSRQEDQASFTILDKKTGQILPIEKFFGFALRRVGEIKPTKNVATAVLGYARQFERKKEYDAILPKIHAYTRALTPLETTKEGVVMDDSLKTFVNTWVNSKKGRRAEPMWSPGGKIDWVIHAIDTFLTIKFLGFNVASGLTSHVGEFMGTYYTLGEKKTALGIGRLATPKGRAFVSKYEEFVGRTPWDSLHEMTKSMPEKLFEFGLMGLFKSGSVRANKIHLLGSLTKEEWESGEVSPERLTEMKVELGRWRVVEGAESIMGKTTFGSVVKRFKSWAFVMGNRASKDIASSVKMLRNGDVKETMQSREFHELVRIGITGALIYLIASSMLDDEDREYKKGESFFEEFRRKALRDAYSVFQAMSPATLLSAPVMLDWLVNLGKAIDSLIKMEEYKSSKKGQYKKGDLKAIPELERLIIPSVLQ